MPTIQSLLPDLPPAVPPLPPADDDVAALATGNDVIVGWDVYLLVEGGLRGRILPWYNCTSLLIVPDAG